MRIKDYGPIVLGFVLSIFVAAGISSYAASPPLVPGNSSMDDPEEATWEGIIIPSTGVLPNNEIHPKLYFDSSFIPVLRERANGEVYDPHGYYVGRWGRISTDAEYYLSQSVSSNDDEKCMAAKSLAFAYLITENTFYLQKAVDNLKEAFSNIQSTDQYVATQMTNYALAYDWIVPYINSSDDTIIRNSVKTGANWLYNYLEPGGPARNHNHRSKAAAALGSWAMAFANDPQAQTYLDRAMLNMHNVWKYMFTKDGIYRDGAGYYWVFTIINSTPFLWQYKNVAGVDLFPTMQPVFEWELKTSTPEGWLPNIEDAWYKICWLVTVADAYKNTPTELSATTTLGELFQWRFFNSSWLPVRYDDNWTGARDQYYGWPDEFILYNSSIAETTPDDAMGTIDLNAGPRGGATIFRNNWDYDNPETRYLYFEGTAMSFNHDHADALQFIIHGENSILACDAGYGPNRFSGRSNYCNAPQHNVITADGSALGDPLPTEHFINTDFYDFAQKEAVYFDDPDAGHVRGIAFPGQDYFVVIDRCTAGNSKIWEAHYHNRGNLSGSGNQRTWTTEAGPWGEAAKMYTFMLPASMSITTHNGKFNPYGSGSYDDGDPYPDPSTDVEDTTFLKMTQTGTTAQYMQVLVPRSTGANSPVFTDLSSAEVLGARVEMDGYKDTFLGQRNITEGTAGLLEATATFAWTRETGGLLKHWAVREGINGSFNGLGFFDSTSPVSAAMDISDHEKYTGYISALGSYTLKIKNFGGLEFGNAVFNGSVVAATVDENDYIVVDLTDSGILVINFLATTTPPEAPADLTADPGDMEVTLNWSAAVGATSYKIYRGTTSGNYSLTADDIVALEYVDTDVVNGTTYYYAVKAANKYGDSGYSNEANATPQLQPPLQPQGLTAEVLSQTVQLSWNDVDKADTYNVYRGTSSGDYTLREGGLTENAFPDTGLTDGVTYYYVVTAVNTAGESPYSEEISVVPNPNPPAAPGGLSATVGSETVYLNWNFVYNADTYNVYRGTSSGNYTLRADELVDPDFTDSGLVNETTYYYVVSASNVDGEGPFSGEVEATPTDTLFYAVDGQVNSYIEAEIYTEKFGTFTEATDTSASNGKFMYTPNGTPEEPEVSYLTYNLQVTNGGTFYVWVRGRGPDGGSDSFFIAVDSGSNIQVNCEVPDWGWKKANNTITLNDGNYVFKVKQREAGSEIDKILLTKSGSLTPSGLGGEALKPQGGGEPDPTPTPTVTPTPTPSPTPSPTPAPVELHYLVDGNENSYIEAEIYTEIFGNFAEETDGGASNGKFMYTPNGSAEEPKNNYLTYRLEVTGGGTFHVWVRGRGANTASDSFFIAADSGSNIQVNCEVPDWGWKKAYDAITLNEGTNILKLKQRESGSEADKILLTKDGQFTPSGLGGDALEPQGGELEPTPTPTATPTPTPTPGSGFYQLSIGDSYIEAEYHTNNYTGNWVVENDVSASNNQYMYLDCTSDDRGNENDVLEYTFNIDYNGTIYIWYRGTKSPKSSTGIWIQLNDGPKKMGTLNSTSWTWTLDNDAAYQITAGEHVFRIYNRYEQGKIDKLLITTDANTTPSGEGGSALPAP